MGNQTHYQTLGISTTASAEDIKKAYRKLAREYHPDINKSQGAEKKMKAINAAYDILSDPQKRADYDRFGTNPTFQQGYQQPYGQNTSQQYYQFDSMDELFAQLFGQRYRNQQYQQNRQQQQQQYQYQQQNRRPVQTSFFGKLVQFFYMFLMIRFLLWFFLPF